ncbi:tetratricopeptide repeat protein [Alteromonas sp. ASW11-36]|uniref:Tetratricopeptide repeat protein n=1 Tax=Alteromonas arenosi TaxID=3055817 RepID=A0ABT7T0R3_9ALTE|nr:tetratricopeptide repeat protein [Alteromonas sp. ASW11-36]MDM7862027.1 tetratricopeptide repeat protein [Alteromonas sp. ASW11-36]
MRLRKVAVAVSCMCALSACSWNRAEVVLAPSNKVAADSTTRDNALVNLTLEPIQAEPSTLPATTLSDLRDQYHALMPMVETLTEQPSTELAWQGELSQDIRNRLADIEMLLAEEAQAEGTTQPADGNYYTVAIEAYEALLATEQSAATPLSPLAKENVLYQLARAYALQGDDQQAVQYSKRLLKQFPHSDFAGELYFREGEYHYNNGNYPAAITAYEKVLQAKGEVTYAYALENDTFYAMSAYMKAWSHFKLEQYSRSIDAFITMLEATLATQTYAQAHKPIDELGLSEQKLVEDALSMTALMFRSQGSADAIVDYFRFAGEKPFTYLVYDTLAQKLLDDSQYRDSARVYLAFAQEYPLHESAIDSFIKHIDVYIIGDFPSDVLPAKQRFIEAYGINGPHWQGFTAEQFTRATPYLEQYLQELAQFEHSLGQQSIAALTELQAEATVDAERQTYLIETRDQAYALAERWYREFIATFGPGEKVADTQFFLAESLYEIGRYAAAVAEYEAFAYTFIDHPQASDAAYTALLSLTELAKEPASLALNDQASAMAFTPLQRSQARFLQYFGDDPRANKIGMSLAQSLFDAQQYLDAMTWAQWLLARDIEPDAQQTARLVLAQSQFEVEDYAAAQGNYQILLTLLNSQDPLHGELTDKLAATFYQQAQQALASAPVQSDPSMPISPERAQALRSAVSQLLQVIEQTPSSAIAVNAQYDAASYLMLLSDWQPAIDLLVDFEQRYPQHELTRSIPERLIVAYENSQQWLAASARLITLWQSDKASEKGREALYLAAEYADKAGAVDIALPHFRTYAHSYPSPLAQANAARYTLSEYYRESGEDSKRRFWLNKLIEADAQAGSERSNRSRYLAAMASSVFADDAFYAFKRIQLTLPLQDSIQQKRDAMQAVIKANQNIIDYKVAEFTTKAGYRLADAYASLAQALYDSERPEGLDALALEQYDILLEEQAYPFEEQAIAIHESNAQRSWQGLYDEWVAQSFAALARLMPAQYNKQEQQTEVDYGEF